MEQRNIISKNVADRYNIFGGDANVTWEIRVLVFLNCDIGRQYRMTITKFSKRAKDIIELKKSYFDDDIDLWKKNIRLSQIYREQPKRKKCKNCDCLINEAPFFTKQDIDYFLCKNCMHLNGGYQDTIEYARQIYLDENNNYAKTYASLEQDSWKERVKAIYQPKADFLFYCLKEHGVRYKNLYYLDVGAGSGYFVQAVANVCGYDHVIGYEPSHTQVRLANKMMGKEIVKIMDMSDLSTILQRCNSEVVSFIGVLEHLIEPRNALKIIADNKKIKYMFVSLPLFSFSVFFELVNQDRFNRQLSEGHTHLYSKESIDYFCKELGFNILGEWYFGTDIVDLFRFNYIKMKQLNVSDSAIVYFRQQIIPIIDQLQSTMDKTKFCSEVHLLIKTNG